MLNLHYHSIWADGLFDCPAGRQVDFHAQDEVTDADVAKLVLAIRSRVLRLLRRLGKLPVEGAPADDPSVAEPTLLDELTAAAVQGRTALGRRRGCRDVRLGRGSLDEPFQRGPLCADFDGFSLHGSVVVPEGARLRLEKLIRYAARPPLAEERLRLMPDGNVVYKLKKRWRDGSTAVVLGPMELLERLCALVPPPRKKLLTYHGVFAPAASSRERVVLAVAETEGGCRHRSATVVEAAEEQGSDGGGGAAKPAQKVPHAPRKIRIPRSRYSWAELMRRVWLVDVLTCPSCRGRRRVLAGIFAADAIRKILTHLGLPCEAPAVAPARAPPQPMLPW